MDILPSLHDGRPVLPDAHQHHLLELPPDRSVLVTGEAGAGKSTVALLRLGALARRAARDRRPFSALILVPTPGLVALFERMMIRMRVQADVATVDGWLGRAARRTFRDLEARDSEGATPGVLAFKRHPAVRAVLPELARSGRRAERADLFELWGDVGLLDEVIAASDGALSDAWAEEVERHAAIQFAEIDVDDDGHPLLGSDGKPSHFGTPLHDAGTADVVDLPVLFELDRLARDGRPPRYHHVVVDEAQELGPLELAVIGRTRAPLTIVGDAAQQVDPTAWFAGWDRAGEELGRPLERVHLTGSHRCPPEVRALARRLADGLPLAPRPSAVVRILTDVDAALDALPPGQTAAVITRTAEAARAVWRGIRPRARLALEDPSGRGVVVTPVTRVRGLEFDQVLVVDLDAAGWPDDPSARSALGVAITRARCGLHLATPGRWSALV